MAIGKAPLSVDEIVRKQKEEKEAASKPVFLTKAQRAALALERRQAELEAQQKREREEREERERFVAQAAGQNSGQGNGQGYAQPQNMQAQGQAGYHHQGYDRFGNGRGGGGGASGRGMPRGRAPPAGPRGAPTGPRAFAPSPLSQGPITRGDAASTSAPPPQQLSTSLEGRPSQGALMDDTDLETIRARYLGTSTAGKKKSRARAPGGDAGGGGKQKFVFDWDAAEDTSGAGLTGREQGVVAGGTMFGGRLAGFDEGGERRGVAGGANDYHADSLERRRAARSGIDDRHWTEKPLAEMRDRDWRIFREDFSIAARGGSIPHPLRSWRESGIPPQILDIIDEIEYKEPSPIQRQAIPIGLSYRDLIGIAQTGSGKTAAFVIPMLEYISHLDGLTDDNRHLGPYALILAPTRELAQQIESETKRFAIPLGYTTVSIVGGRSVEEQQFNLRNGAEIIIATPGRLKDLIDRNILVLSQCRYVVMDEADRMVDLGFENDLTFILNAMPEDNEQGSIEGNLDSEPAARDGDKAWKGHRVTTLFSATMPPIVERLAKQYLRRPATVVIGNVGEAVDSVEQRVEFVTGEDKKKARLQELLRTLGLPPPMIVFVNEKKTADQVVRYVQGAGRRATTLHSGKNQEQREAALQSLRDGDVEVLVATDLAGRGIDVPDVTCVINWQMSSTIEKYIHRIGRTGRAGKQGIAITFLGPSDEETMYDLKQEIARSPISTVPNELERHPAARQRITREMKRKRDDNDE
ncbi:hypothetical protein NliqN6_5802 [Naganishia liquefaciens]|uniref:RNA helicase n=1 Tax=Naganishia liquefaciens TaxID=104408 RepID=A0A8H3TYW0_9TREE|nr:hypothetical protein NliqN6_5802 [Naganishia liquefaciens]